MPDFIDVPPWVAVAIEADAAQVAATIVIVPSKVETTDSVPPLAEAARAVLRDSSDWMITLSIGSKCLVHGQGLIGRNPAAREGEKIDHFIAVGDVEKSVSKTHLAFGVEGSHFWVEDRNSTNGTILLSDSGTATACPAGKRTIVLAGQTVQFGELTLTIAKR